MGAPELPPLAFRLALDDGRAVLDLPEGCATGLAEVEKLRLEVPDVRYPFDLTAGLSRFQDRRCQLRALTVSLAVPQISAWLTGTPLPRYGLHDLWLQPTPAGLRLVLRADLAGRTALVSGRLALRGRPGGWLRLEIQSARAYGFLPVPVPLVVAGLFTALGASPPTGQPRPLRPPADPAPWWSRPPALLAMSGPTGLDLAALDLFLYPLLAARGWRLPERRAVSLTRVAVAEARVRLEFLAPGEPDRSEPSSGETSSPQAEPAADLFALGEEALAAGELRAAREAYRHAAAASPGGAAEERLLSLLLAGGESLAAASEQAEAQLARRPDDPGAQLARAVVAAEAGRLADAAGFFQQAAGTWAEAGESLEAACARHAASELLERAGRGAEARAELEGALAAWTDQGAPLRGRWVERLSGAGVTPASAEPEGLGRARARWLDGDLAGGSRDYEALLAERGALAGPAAAEAHLRLAQWARLNGQMMVASRHLGQALKLEPGAGAPLPVLVEVLEAFGRTEELEAALIRRRGRAASGPDQRALARALGAVLERSGRAPEAVTIYEQLLTGDPQDLETLARLAEIHRRERQHPELAATLERLFALGLARAANPSSALTPADQGDPGAIDLETVGLDLAQLYDDALDARDRAAVVLERLCAALPQSREAREALAALDRRPAGAED